MEWNKSEYICGHTLSNNESIFIMYDDPIILSDFEKLIEPFVPADEIPELVAFQEYYASSAKIGDDTL